MLKQELSSCDTPGSNRGIRPWKFSIVSNDRIVRSLLGILLLIAAYLKWRELVTTPTFENNLWSSRWILVGVVEFELLAGLWMLLNLTPHATHRCAIVGFLLFAAVSCFKGMTGASSCGCFGGLQINPWITFVFDSLAMVALLCFRPVETQIEQAEIVSQRQPQCSLLNYAAALMIWLSLGVPGGLVMANFRPTSLSLEADVADDGRIVLLEPETWAGKQFPLLRFIDIGEELALGEWIVVLYHHDCAKCKETLPEYENLARTLRSIDAKQRVALVEISPYDDLPTTSETYCRHGQLDRSHDWFVSTPTEIVIRQGAVVRRDSSVASHDILRQSEAN